jgi:hypothetical protein
MANGLLPLIFETQSGKLVFSDTDLSEVALKDLFQEDGLNIAFQAVKRINRVVSPLAQKISLSGYSLRVSVGVAGNPYAQATPGDFTLSDDGYVYNGTLNLNTSEIDALADGAEAKFEIHLSSGSILHRGQYTVKIRKAVHTTGVLVPVATDRALGAQEADRTFVKKIMAAGDWIEWGTAGGRRFAEYMHDDGTKRLEEIT